MHQAHGYSLFFTSCRIGHAITFESVVNRELYTAKYVPRNDLEKMRLQGSIVCHFSSSPPVGWSSHVVSRHVQSKEGVVAFEPVVSRFDRVSGILLAGKRQMNAGWSGTPSTSLRFTTVA